jgi:hypothetical protein
MGDFFELTPRFVQERIGLGATLDRARFATPRTLRDRILGDHRQQVGDEGGNGVESKQLIRLKNPPLWSGHGS